MGKYVILRPLDKAEYQALKATMRNRGVIIPVSSMKQARVKATSHRVRR